MMAVGDRGVVLPNGVCPGCGRPFLTLMPAQATTKRCLNCRRVLIEVVWRV